MYLVKFKAKPANMELFSKWLHNPHVSQWYEHPENWIYEAEHHKEEFNWIKSFFVEVDTANVDGARIGFCQYYPYAMSGEDWNGTIPAEGTYSLDYLIGEEEYLGQGYGKQIVLCMMAEILENRKAQRIIVQPDEQNKISQKTLLATGFHYDEENKLYLIERKEMEKEVHKLDEMIYGSALPIFMCIGASLGLLIGVALNNIAIGILFGISIGTLIGSGIDERRKKARSMVFPTKQNMKITSPTLKEGEIIPDKHIAKGENLSPELDIEGIPENAAALAVVMDDIEHPIDGIKNHWCIWNIPVQSVIPEGVPAGEKVESLSGAIQGMGFGKNAYKGPVASGEIMHRYRFHVFALDSMIKVPLPESKFEMMTAMKGHIIGYGNLTGKYGN